MARLNPKSILNIPRGMMYDPSFGVGCYRILLRSNGVWGACFEARSLTGNRLTGSVDADSLTELDEHIKLECSREIQDAYAPIRKRLEESGGSIAHGD